VERREPTDTPTKILSWFDGFNSNKIANPEAVAIFSTGQLDIEQLCLGDAEKLHTLADRTLAARLLAIPENEKLRAAANMHFAKAIQMI
jgi:hypothetical protein